MGIADSPRLAALLSQFNPVAEINTDQLTELRALFEDSADEGGRI